MKEIKNTTNLFYNILIYNLNNEIFQFYYYGRDTDVYNIREIDAIELILRDELSYNISKI